MTTVKLLLQRRGVGWGGDGLFNSYTSRDSLYDISAPQANFFLSVLHVFAPGNVISNVISRGFEVTNPQNFPPAAEFP